MPAQAVTIAETYNDKVVRQFAIMTIVWAFTFSRLRPLHTNAVIFAFGGSALFATALGTSLKVR